MAFLSALLCFVSFVMISFLIAKPTPASLLSPSGLPLQKKEYSKSSRLPDSENLVSHRAAMSMLYLASSIATSAVRLSGRLAPSRSRRVLTFQAYLVINQQRTFSPPTQKHTSIDNTEYCFFSQTQRNM